jgi:hypothetical protein
VTDRGVIHALDGETGQTLWTQDIGSPGFPTTAATANDSFVALCNGSTIYMLDRRNGQILWSRRAIGAVAAGPAITEEMVAVPMLNGAVENYRVEGQRTGPNIYKSKGSIFVAPVPTARSVAWTTDLGHMYVTDASTGKPRFRLEASDTIVGGVAYLPPRYLFTASFDGYAYGVDEISGDQLWRYSSGSTISQTPVAIGESVFVVTDQAELHAIDANTGGPKEVKSKQRLAAEAAAAMDPAAAAVPPPSNEPRVNWPVVRGIKSIISASPTRLYCLGRPGQLMIVDIRSGALLGVMQIGVQDVVLHNQATDRLILGTSAGLVQCLQERQFAWPHGPIVHAVEMEKLAPRREVIQQPAPAAPMPAVQPMPMENMPNPPTVVDPFAPAK